MKHFTIILSLFFFGLSCTSQNFSLKVFGNSSIENKVIDSLNYNKAHKNIKSLNDEILLTSEQLTKIGYIENEIVEIKKLNDSSYTSTLCIGKRIKWVYIYI